MWRVSSSYINDSGNELNFSNPAVNKNSYYTIFNVSLNSDFYILKFLKKSNRYFNDYYISNLFFKFFISRKNIFCLRLQPHTGINYQIIKTEIKNKISFSTLNIEHGLINSLHAFIFYSINKNINIRILTNYLFFFIGKIYSFNSKTNTLILNIDKKNINFQNSNLHLKFFTQNLLYRYILNTGKIIKLSPNINKYLISTQLHYFYLNSFNKKKLNS